MYMLNFFNLFGSQRIIVPSCLKNHREENTEMVLMGSMLLLMLALERYRSSVSSLQVLVRGVPEKNSYSCCDPPVIDIKHICSDAQELAQESLFRGFMCCSFWNRRDSSKFSAFSFQIIGA